MRLASRPKRFFLVHGGVLLVIAGALLSRAYRFQAVLPLIEGVRMSEAVSGREACTLPFSVTLRRFRAVDAGGAIADFESEVRLDAPGESRLAKVKVNSPVSFRGYRLYQQSYDPADSRASVLLVTRDPGTRVVFAGFSLMSAGLLLWMF